MPRGERGTARGDVMSERGLREPLIFDLSKPGRGAASQFPPARDGHAARRMAEIPQRLRRAGRPRLPEVSELQAVRHFTRLSQLNFSIDSHFYPLGSCTMKYNPKACNTYAMLPEFLSRHPLAPEPQGFLACMFELQEMLKEITGMQGVSLSPMAGAQGEFAGVAMIRAYHQARNDSARTEIIVPQAAHGTNPATATMCGCTVKEIPCDKNGGIDLSALEAAVGPATAGIMLTNPSTLGVFEHRIAEVARIVHQAGGLLYYDGANLNAILGKVRPGDMGFDVIHMNLHKTFSTPHGGGGPGSGAVGVGPRLLPYLPIPLVGCRDGRYRWLTERELPNSIGRLSGFMGNSGVNLRAYVYMRMLGRQGMVRVSEFAALNANYLMKRLTAAGYEAAYPARRASHEFIITLRSESRLFEITAMDVAKRLLDFGVHAPTTYFPLLVPECLLIEPTETETKEELDHFCDAMREIRQEMEREPEKLRSAPHTMPVRRLDDVRAVKQLDIAWKPGR
jgi:glycine dehydrogenase subunit 2